MQSSLWTETPTLVGEHVTLTPLRTDHAEGVLQASTDDTVFTWMRFDRPTTSTAAEALVDHYLATPSSMAWAQIDNRTGEVAGITTYYEINPERRSVFIGSTWLGERFQRTGINTEAKLLLLTYAFETLGAIRVAWEVDNLNTKSQAAVERLGATREGVLRKHKRRKDGSWRDTVVFSLVDDEWPQACDGLRERLAGRTT